MLGPFNANLLAVSTAQNFGIIGSGKQYIIDTKGGMKEIAAMQTKVKINKNMNFISNYKNQ